MFEALRTWARAHAEAAVARRRLMTIKELAAELPRDLAVVMDGEGVSLLVRRLPERAAPGAES